MGAEILFGKMKTFWRWMVVDGCKTSVDVLKTTDCTLKVVRMVKFVMYILP